ncbi:MAG TPA: hypothetical protein DCG75_18890 [Bacteroidales bacterium]|nr:hypothetical protein [Bacteroidales bacterium]
MENKKIYNLKQIEAACVIGSPIAAGLLIAHNYKKWNNDRQAIIWIIIGILWTAGIISLAFFIPEGKFEKSLSLLPFINGLVLYPIINKLQGNQINEHFNNNGEKASNWNIAGIISLILLLLFIPLFILNQSSPINNYSRKDFYNCAVLYNNEMPLNEVEKLGNILIRVQYFDPNNQSEVVFADNDSIYVLKLIIDKSYFNNKEFLIETQSLIKHINKYEFSKPIFFKLIDEFLTDEKELSIDNKINSPVILETAKFVKNKNFNLYYDIAITEKERLKFQDIILSLNKVFPQQYEIDFAIEIIENSYKLNLFNPKTNWNNPQVLSEAALIKNKLNQGDFSKPFRLFLYDEFESNLIEKEIE